LSRGAGAVLAPVGDQVPESGIDSDHRLVAAVRGGDDRAFEALYQRYQRRIHAYVLGMVKDHGRAEDVTQEVFVSALRRMRATDRPIAFKPWIYEIAKNACIDAFRRSKRGEEVSFDAEGGLAPADQTRLVARDPAPEAAVAAKHDLETLCGAFGGLSESHHEILVLRELEGLTYEQIGERMGLTRPAVESTLFRARRRLSEEYDELVSGARCLRVQAIIAAAASGALGVRDSRRLSRHLSHCQVCRREAMAAGLDRGLLVRRPATRRFAEKVAGILPLPAFLRWRGGRGGDGAAPSGSGVAAHLPALSDQLSGPWSKAAAGLALLLAGVGTGVGVHQATEPHHAALKPAATIHRTSQGSRAATPAPPAASVTAADSSSRSRGASGEGARGSDHRRSASRRSKSTGSGGGGQSSAPGAGGTAPAASSTPGAGSSASSSGSDASPAKTVEKQTPKVVLPSSTPTAPAAVQNAAGQAGDAVNQAANTVDSTVQKTTGAVQDATQQAGNTVNGIVGGATGGQGPLPGATQAVTDTANQVVGAAKTTVDTTTSTVTTTVKDVSGGLLGGH
jgi:RNA polymerase sigma factor (sigma-70 family)